MKRLHILFLFLFPIIAFCQQPELNEVEIIRDQWGVPHIYGKTDAQVAYGLAWANAEDDFQTMQLNLLMARTSMGKEEGLDGAIIDYGVHLFRIKELVAEKYDADVSPEFKLILEAYAKGLNKYAETYPEEVLQKGVFPVTPQDVLVGYQMSLAVLLGVTFHVENIFEGEAGGPTPYSLKGSNGMAFSSKKMKDGSTVLVSNSHQPLDGQGTWYEAHLVSDEGTNILGATFCGGVSIFAGATPNLSWMHTVNYEDFVDVYELVLNPKNKKQYRFDGEWKTIEEKKVTLKVKLAGMVIPVKRKVWWSEYGPTIVKKGKAYALRFPVLLNIKAAEQWWRMNKASNWTEFREALDMQGLPGLNLLYADKEDHIYYLNNGLFPKRDPNFGWLELVQGDTSATLWNEFHPVEDLIQRLDPVSGYVYNTNNTPYSCTGPEECPKFKDYPSTMGHLQIENNRSLRFQELIAQYDKLDMEDIRTIKYDRTYPSDSIYVYFICNINDIFKLDPEKYPDIAEAIQMIKEWDRTGQTNNKQAALFLLIYDYLLKLSREDPRFPVCNVFPEKEIVNSVRYAKKYLKRHFGKLDIELGEMQRLVRGKKDYPAGGLPDVVATLYSKDWKKGKRRGWLGDSYIQFIQYVPGEAFPRMQSCITYGASNKEGDPHFDDQVDMYLNQKTKTISLDLEEARKTKERSYCPK